MRRPVLATILAALVGAFAFVGPSAHASSYTPSTYAARLLSLVNQARGNNGLAPLREASGTTSVAAGWTAHMASTRTLAHNPDLQHQLETHGSANWTTYGENVGEGASSDPDGLFRAYMQSPEHRANILTGAYRYVGVAVTFGGGTAWNTFDFVDAYGTAAKAPAPAPATHVVHHAAAPAPAPRRAASPAPVAKHTARHHHATARSHRRHHPVRVKGERLHAPAPRQLTERTAVLGAPVPAASVAVEPRQGSRSRPFAIAAALLAFAAASWSFGRRFA